jgi:hypothetical protein
MINFSLLDEAFPNEDKTSLKKKSKKEGSTSKEGTKEGKDCSPIQAPIYEIPNTCDNKQVFRNVMNDAMKNDYLNKNDYKKDGISSFDFDEMDAYLSVNNINTNNQDRSSEYNTTPYLLNYLKSLKDNLNKDEYSKSTDKTLNIEQFSGFMNANSNSNSNFLNIDNNLILIMFLGIILILLIDQITRLAIALKS